jgi:hypothetical protein
MNVVRAQLDRIVDLAMGDHVEAIFRMTAAKTSLAMSAAVRRPDLTALAHAFFIGGGEAGGGCLGARRSGRAGCARTGGSPVGTQAGHSTETPTLALAASEFAEQRFRQGHHAVLG